MAFNQNVTSAIRGSLSWLAKQLEEHLDADVITIFGPMIYGLDDNIREAIESFDDSKNKLVVLLTTDGGLVEVVERIVQIFRHKYQEVVFIIPDRAMSAGTVLAMSGDAIYMDYYSLLGPIDPQVSKNGTLVPALSYLTQLERILAKFNANNGTTADLRLLDKFDMAELHKFEEARELSKTLLENWLAKYKFKDWNFNEISRRTVTDEMKATRAREIATDLSNHEKWHSHARGISMEVLRNELNLRIDDFGADPTLADKIRSYHNLLVDFIQKENFSRFVHTRHYF